MKKFKDPARALAAWSALVKNQERHERLIADLVAHPAVAPEQLVDAANRLRTMRASVREAYVIVRERLPWGIAELLPVPAFMRKER